MTSTTDSLSSSRIQQIDVSATSSQSTYIVIDHHYHHHHHHHHHNHHQQQQHRHHHCYLFCFPRRLFGRRIPIMCGMPAVGEGRNNMFVYTGSQHTRTHTHAHPLGINFVTLHSKRDKLGTGFGIQDNSASRETS